MHLAGQRFAGEMKGRRPAVCPRDQRGIAIRLSLLSTRHHQPDIGFDERVVGIVGIKAFVRLRHVPQKVHAVQPVLDDDVGIS